MSPASLNPPLNAAPTESLESKATQPPEVNESGSSYNEILNYVDNFKSWRSAANIKPISPEVYEDSIPIKIPRDE